MNFLSTFYLISYFLLFFSGCGERGCGLGLGTFSRRTNVSSRSRLGQIAQRLIHSRSRLGLGPVRLGSRTFSSRRDVSCILFLSLLGCQLIHRKVGNGQTFHRTWAEFKSGFGDPNGDAYWIGNDRIHDLTSAGYRRLEIKMLTNDLFARVELFCLFYCHSETQ